MSIAPTAPATTESPAEAAPLSPSMRTAVLLAVVLPFIGFIVSVILLWGRGFTWVELVLLVVMYTVTGLGVTLGYHRLFTHRSFETRRPIRFILGVMGSMAVQGSLLKWVADHRRHHQLSDLPGDPHSPHLHGGGLFGMLRGIWHSHVGWLFEPAAPGLHQQVKDLLADRIHVVVDRLFVVWVALGLLIPAVLGGLLAGSWWGVLLGFLWGGLARIFLVHHLTWSINSICHIWGGQPFRSRDQSRNNVFFGIMAFGEGWHNNHHAFPTSARHGLFWWQFDLTYVIIRAMQAVGLAWEVRLPTPAALAVRANSRS